jgi:hypothetical protein
VDPVKEPEKETEMQEAGPRQQDLRGEAGSWAMVSQLHGRGQRHGARFVFQPVCRLKAPSFASLWATLIPHPLTCFIFASVRGWLLL